MDYVTIDGSFIGAVYDKLNVNDKLKPVDKQNINKYVCMVVDYGDARVAAETSKLRDENEKLKSELERVREELLKFKAKRKNMMEEISAMMND
jgi:hypothetical protein